MTSSLDRAAANLRNHHEVDNLSENSCLNPPPLEPSSSTKGVPLCCGSPSRSSTSSRTRSRTPSPPQSSHTSRQSSLRNSSKVPRSMSPGGTVASSAPDVSRSRRGVRFEKRLVTAVYTRPKTPMDQRAKLFYSRSDEIRFREEAAYACDDDWLDQLEEDSLPDETAYGELQQQQRTTYSISKAVVVFGSTTRTYGGGCAVEAALESEKASAFSFDDDAFWSGQLTWS
eukprot:CAMPEP_0113400208 /NCGR_PEP_ID=MMETSP0013_2-20120614/15993_1 /TAXON_ID=2843 ORGANISM="Skeletonema costatum, Strain 1716" /NCGR_SAMPLE_ID=MMETSP0013_2 /ASSEMBLY_ACC=CAM_ASM_000158 /LENGTH=227 /DNA_ID=CAMNT_0000285247 /DNA_START=50 /DNA_END=733 /DNA_ORIENTATION=+ /assembly_acc=CAM_ASM_000158